MSRCRVLLGVVVLVGAGSLAAPAHAANPHLVSADPTISDPVVSPGSFTWDSSLVVPFRIAGLGKNAGLDVTLNALLTYSAFAEGTTAENTVFANFGYTSPSGFNVSLSGSASAPGSVTLSVALSLTNPNLTSDKNGTVSGTLAIPGVVNGTIPDNLACVQVSWTQITLTFNGQVVAVPDVSGRFDSTGSVCP